MKIEELLDALHDAEDALHDAEAEQIFQREYHIGGYSRALVAYIAARDAVLDAFAEMEKRTLEAEALADQRTHEVELTYRMQSELAADREKALADRLRAFHQQRVDRDAGNQKGDWRGERG